MLDEAHRANSLSARRYFSARRSRSTYDDYFLRSMTRETRIRLADTCTFLFSKTAALGEVGIPGTLRFFAMTRFCAVAHRLPTRARRRTISRCRAKARSKRCRLHFSLHAIDVTMMYARHLHTRLLLLSTAKYYFSLFHDIAHYLKPSCNDTLVFHYRSLLFGAPSMGAASSRGHL